MSDQQVLPRLRDRLAQWRGACSWREAAMSTQQVFRLDQDALLRLPYGRGTSVACLEGAIWVTHDDDLHDVILEPGTPLRLRRDRAILQALRPATVAIDAPGTYAIEAAARWMRAFPTLRPR